MKLLGDAWDFAKRLATIDETLKRMEETSSELTSELKLLGRNLHELDVRIARLEESRDLEKQRVETELERFKLQVERFELRVRQLPPSSTD